MLCEKLYDAKRAIVENSIDVPQRASLTKTRFGAWCLDGGLSCAQFRTHMSAALALLKKIVVCDYEDVQGLLSDCNALVPHYLVAITHLPIWICAHASEAAVAWQADVGLLWRTRRLQESRQMSDTGSTLAWTVVDAFHDKWFAGGDVHTWGLAL